MYAIYGNIYHQYTPNVSIYTIHGSYGIWKFTRLCNPTAGSKLPGFQRCGSIPVSWARLKKTHHSQVQRLKLNSAIGSHQDGKISQRSYRDRSTNYNDGDTVKKKYMG